MRGFLVREVRSRQVRAGSLQVRILRRPRARSSSWTRPRFPHRRRKTRANTALTVLNGLSMRGRRSTSSSARSRNGRNECGRLFNGVLVTWKGGFYYHSWCRSPSCLALRLYVDGDMFLYRRYRGRSTGGRHVSYREVERQRVRTQCRRSTCGVSRRQGSLERRGTIATSR